MTPKSAAPDLCARCAKPRAALLSTKEAAACLGVAFSTMEAWIHNYRLLPKYRVGYGRGRIRLLHSDLDVLVRKDGDPPLRAVTGGRR